MLARDYNAYYQPNAYELEKAERERARRVARRQLEQRKKQHILLKRIGAVFGVVIATYGIVVIRSITLMGVSNDIVAMQQKEAQMVGRNSELSIAVEQLKGPERIMSIAATELGMNVARHNFYVKAYNEKVANEALAMAKK